MRMRILMMMDCNNDCNKNDINNSNINNNKFTRE